jgi:hypothetical protein
MIRVSWSQSKRRGRLVVPTVAHDSLEAEPSRRRAFAIQMGQLSVYSSFNNTEHKNVIASIYRDIFQLQITLSALLTLVV